jgi:hypothetical protein
MFFVTLDQLVGAVAKTAIDTEPRDEVLGARERSTRFRCARGDDASRPPVQATPRVDLRGAGAVGAAAMLTAGKTPAHVRFRGR